MLPPHLALTLQSWLGLARVELRFHPLFPDEIMMPTFQQANLM